MTPQRKKIHRAWGILGCIVLILASTAGALYQGRELKRLLKGGRRAHAVVVDIAVGARGAKRAVLEFETEGGPVVRTKDLFLMMFVRHRRADRVTVLYDPSEPSIATVDLGPWTWQEPGFLAFGALFLTGLLVFILKAEEKPSHR